MKIVSFSKSQTITNAYDLVAKYLGTEPTGHDAFHIKRVVKLALHIASSLEEEVDLFLLELSALLHDIEDPKLNHRGQNIVKTFLDTNLVPHDYQLKINDIIDNLSYSASLKGKFETQIEGKILQDADRLEALGAIGIARTFAYGGHKGRLIVDDNDPTSTIHHFEDKLLKLESLMNTEEGKKRAQRRTRFIKLYLAQFESEIKIKD